ncbi:sigma-70 family RNA polymerase sigma factor [Fulvivirga sp. RKSG066]|uniref:RNA polymerase sigma factor n=1 Tax=Fulvivirga aurantia TaxID=2529383 RepID=UPI0012BBBC77|nr:sigma-70 family RNA polymerase sigma factor [Fulvivirga aurantia]MTI22632.1 sigma-70 family RNA polymerase sigma factor [Fulvivirga aurantia]
MYISKSNIPVDDVLLQIRQGDESLLRQLYEMHRARFINWFQAHHQVDKSEAVDLYQRSFTTFYLNVKDNKIQSLNSSIATYIFGIGKNLIREDLRKKNKDKPLGQVKDDTYQNNDLIDKEAIAHQKSIVRGILEKIGEPCKSILMMYYFKNFSMDSIAQHMGYKSENVAKKKKCLCLQRIREQVNQSKLKYE